VTIDGASKPDVDLYSETPVWKSAQLYSGLKNAKHTIVIRVSGEKNPNATNTNVVFDAFVTGLTTIQDNSRLVQYGSWKSAAATGASGGTYRSNESSGSVAKLTFTGTAVDWITTKGPKFGQAEVFVDGASQGVRDLYSPSMKWKVAFSFPASGGGLHTIEIRPMGTKNTASTGTGVVLDAFKGRIIAAASPQGQAVGPSPGEEERWRLWLLPFGLVGFAVHP
jgi:hypothetical protein